MFRELKVFNIIIIYIASAKAPHVLVVGCCNKL